MSRVSDIQNFIIIACRNTFSGHSKIVRKSLRNSFISIPYIYIGLLFVLYSCSGSDKKTTQKIDTPTRGDIKILVDESFQPIIETEVNSFLSLYNWAKIKPLYKPEVDITNEFMSDSCKVMVTSRKLSDDQIKYLRDTLIVARTTKFAYDALALVTNKENHDTLLKYSDVKSILTGKILSWKDLDNNSRLGNIRIIFDNPKSGNIRFFREKFEFKDALPSNFFAVNSNAEVIDFVSKNKDAIGIISVNWISDKDDSTGRSYIKKINVVAVSQEYFNDTPFYRPDQGWIANKTYPFVREIYLVSRETYKGLGSGFIQWATAEKGQRIVLKSGLVPATMPIRLVQIKRE
jgi:phosphate transport system substrate-binding protein